MSTVVITDSCRGLGYELTKKYLALGWNVVINAYCQEKLYDTEKKLNAMNYAGEVFAYGGSVSNMEDMKLLAVLSDKKFGGIDLWINNSEPEIYEKPVLEMDISEMRTLIDTKILGVICGSKAAMSVMKNRGKGSIYTIEDSGQGVLDMTKSAVRSYMDTLTCDAKDTGVEIKLVGAEFFDTL